MSQSPRILLKKQLTIKRYVRQGYSANQIQKKMKAEGMGVRRKTLLAYVREIQHKPQPQDREKYVPKKRTSGTGSKSVTIFGVRNRRTYRHTHRARTGKDLYKWIRKQYHSGQWDYIAEINS
jgi:hypothetical protein